MKYYRFPENRMTKIGFGLFLFVLLYLCRDTMFCLSVVGFYKATAISLAVTALAGLAFLWYQRRNLKDILLDSRMVMVLAATVCVLLPMVLKRDWQLMYFSILICLYTAIFLSYFITWQEVAKYYVLILTALGIYSVFAAYLFRIPIDMGLVQKEVFKNGAGSSFYNFFFSVVPRTYVKFRNFGIFREPGVYQYFVLLALVLTHYGVQWKKVQTMWILTAILSVVMLTTFATGGIIELGLLALFVFFEKKLYRNKLLVSIVLVLLVLGSYCLWDAYDDYDPLWQLIELNFVNKFKNQEDSSVERSQAIVANMQMMLQHPVVGAKLSDVLHVVENNTSSTLILLAGLGPIFGSLHIAAWAALVWKKERHILANLFLMFILFLSFNTQNLSWDLFFWLFPIMALTERVMSAVQTRLGRGAA